MQAHAEDSRPQPEEPHLFWPQQRVDALRRYAQEELPTDDRYERSMRLQWMREFCVQAPSWLEAEGTRAAMRSKLDGMRQAMAQMQLELEALAAQLRQGPTAPDKLQDGWAEATHRVEVAKADAGPMGMKQAQQDAEKIVAERPVPQTLQPGQLTPVEQMFAGAPLLQVEPATKRRRAPRTNFKKRLAAIAEEHGEDLALYVVDTIMGNEQTTRRADRAMQRYIGRFANRVDAANAYARSNGRRWPVGTTTEQVLQAARYVLEHEDGQVSIWR